MKTIKERATERHRGERTKKAETGRDRQREKMTKKNIKKERELKING